MFLIAIYFSYTQEAILLFERKSGSKFTSSLYKIIKLSINKNNQIVEEVITYTSQQNAVGILKHSRLGEGKEDKNGKRFYLKVQRPVNIVYVYSSLCRSSTVMSCCSMR